jgi:hypothetical protein
MTRATIPRPDENTCFTAGTAGVIGGCFALAAFGVAVIAGLVSGNEALTILIRALLTLLVCYPVGWCAGLICQKVLDDHLRAHQQANPAPDSRSESPDVDSGKDEEEMMVV